MSSYEESEGSVFEEYIFTGRVLNERYILISQIGSGTFATVWSCYDIRSKNYLAIKIQDIEEHECAVDELTFYTTINKGGNVGGAHKYLCTMLDFFPLESDYGINDCFVFNLAACSTYDVIRYIKYSKDKQESPLSLLNIKRIIYQTLLAIKSINDNYNLLHTDIRAENILICGSNKHLDLFKSVFDPNYIEKIVVAKRKKFTKKYKKKPSPEIETKFYEETSIPYIQKLLSDEKFKVFRDEDSHESSHHQHSQKDKECQGSQCSKDSDSENSNSSHQHGARYDKYDSFSDLEDFIEEVPSEEIILDKEINMLPLDNKYLENIQIKLADFGSACFADKKYSTIQARHYRAPEIVIGCPFNESCDIWSLGCLMFELMTGEVLFKPNKSPFISRNKFHLYKMYKLFGPIPPNMIDNCKYRKIFFNNDHTLKISRHIKRIDMKDYIKHEISRHHVQLTISEEELIQAVDFMMLTFEYDPEKRSNASKLVLHKWFDDIRINN